MSKRIGSCLWLVLLGVALGTGVPSTALGSPIVYSNGTTDSVNGNEMTEWVQAEDFTLGSTTTITDVHFWSLEYDEFSLFDGDIYYGIFTDASGSPNLGAPGVEGFAAGTNLTRQYVGQGAGDIDDYEVYYYSFDITPFVALGGTTYWLALHNGPLEWGFRSEFYWATTAANGTAPGHEDSVYPALGDGWAASFGNQEHAFELTGTREAPEPATLALLGFGVAAGYLRRRRSA